MQKRFLIIAVAIVSLCLGGVASAITATWTGDSSSSLLDRYNWTPELAPAAGDLLIAKPGNFFEPIFAETGTTTTGSLYVDHGALVLVNSGTLRMTSALADSGGLAVFNDSLDTDGLTINSGATFQSTQNVYIGGHGNGLGRVTVSEGGTMLCSTLTIGYQSNQVEGLLNVFGGTVNMGTLLRIAPYSAKPCIGKIDVRNGTTLPGVLTGKARTGTTDNILPSYAQQLVDEGYIVSEPGYTPVVKAFDVNGVEVAFEDVNGVTTQITAKQVYYATAPSPVASGSHQTYSAAQTLSWVKPLPRVPGDVVTSNVYFGTANPPTTLVGTAGQTDAFVTVSTSPEKTYYWKVDSFDPNGGVTVPTPANAVWTFDTIIAPTVSVGYSGRLAAMRTSDPNDPNSTAVLVATASDDGYPMALQYTWSAGTLDPNVSYSDPFALNPTATFDTPTLDYPLTLTVFDGAQTATATVTVRVFAAGDYCGAAKWPTTFSALTGDMDVDCIVGAKDLAVLAAQWLECNSLDCQ